MVKTAVRHLGIWARMLHIYASMAGFVLVLLFAVTGITLNHQDSGWGEPQAYDDELDLAFHAPGRRVHAIVTRATGQTQVMTEWRGKVGVINDLHKGMETGTAWRWLVDFTAAGALVVLLIYWATVPS